MLTKRVLTVIVGAPVLFGVLGVAPKVVFSVLILVTAILGNYEYFEMTFAKHSQRLRWGGIVGATLISALLIGASDSVFILPTMMIVWLLTFVVFLLRDKPLQENFQHLSAWVVGLVYPAMFIPFIAMIHQFPDGTRWVLFLLLTIWSGDTGAYLAGRLWGRHKLYFRISPGKTVEGAIAGTMASILVAILFKMVVFEETILLWNVVGLGFLVSVVGQLGDLFESMIKRTFDVKDSGWILPGHGGILDRMDAVMFAAPVVYLYIKVFHG